VPKLHLKDCGLDIKGEINRYMTYLKQKPGSLEDVIAKQQSPYQESAYQDKFKKELDKAGRGIGSMTPKEKTAFFNKVEESVQAEALAPEKQKENDKLMKDFIAKGGKVQNIPIGKRNFQGNKLIVRAAQKKLKEEKELKEKDGANTSTRTGSASRNAKKKYRFGYRVAEKQPKGNDIEESASELVKKAIAIAKKMANNYTGATNAIEALKKGLSKDPAVSAALLAANENFVKENVGHQLWGKAVSDTENRGDSKLLPSKNIQQEADEKDSKGASTAKVPPVSKDNKPGVKIAKIRLKRDKMDGAEGSGTKDPAAQEKQILTLTGQINVLKAKLENEKHKIMKPVASKETGQVPLTIGLASKLLRDKAEKEDDKKEVKKESVSPYKLKYETLRARLKEKAEKEKLAKKKNEPTKGRTMTGEPATKVDTKPEISYTM
jgi:hypothetical protein